VGDGFLIRGLIDMEKKKLLLVAVSVGVFLVIIIGAAILLFTPQNTPPAPVEAAVKPSLPVVVPPQAVDNQVQQPVSVDAADMVKNAQDVQGLQTPPATATAIQENVFYIYGENPQAVAVEKPEDRGAPVVIDIPKPSTAAVPDTPAAVPNTPPPAPRTAAAPVRRQTAPATASRTPPAAAAKPAPAPQTKLYDDYWVQTGSFSTKARADGVKETLASKGIVSVIENREVEGKTYYRVRVGPYTSQNEADYWLSLIKSINGFEDSQVWKSQSRR
jgi:DedD protein